MVGWRDRETQMAGRLEKARERAARVASYISSYGQLGKGRPDRKPESGRGEKTHHYTSWFMLSKFCRDGDCKSKTFLSPVLRMASWSGDAQRVSHPLRIPCFSSLLGSWPSPDVYRERLSVGMCRFSSYQNCTFCGLETYSL